MEEQQGEHGGQVEPEMEENGRPEGIGGLAQQGEDASADEYQHQGRRVVSVLGCVGGGEGRGDPRLHGG